MSENNIENKKSETGSIIRNHMMWSMGAGLIPFPIADIIAVGAVQLDMIRQLSRVYEIDFNETKGKAIISALTTSSLSRLGARAAIKLIPGIGSILGGVAMSVMSGASTYALGEVFKAHFETGGTILDFEPERLKKFYNEKFEKGKDIAKKMKEDEDLKKNQHKKDPITLIKELNDLRESGAISQEEFERLKKQVLD